MYIKREKKQHMRDKGEEKHTSSYISKNTMYVKSGHKTMVHEVRKDTPKPYYIPQSTLPLSSISYTSSPLNKKTTLTCKTTSLFCHEWQRVHHWEVVISSSLEELEPLASSLSSSPSEEDSSAGSGEGEGVKPLRRIGSEQCDWFWCSFDISHQKNGQNDYQNQHA